MPLPMEQERCLGPQLWHACAGGMVSMPALNSLVYYFPQGHAEHAQGAVDFGSCPRIPPFLLCKVSNIDYKADAETDEVFAKMKLVPTKGDDLACNGDGYVSDSAEKPPSFAKTLTQSDANNGGGFSVPRYCAETIFPRLDYTTDPPAQTVLAKDVHGEIWKFRHIYRGTPRRHLLTTGWSSFVNQKKLMAGDSIVFLRTAKDELCVGIRRAKRRAGGELDSPPSGWSTPSAISGFPLFSREDETRTRGRHGNSSSTAEAVIRAAKLAASGQPFEVVYYPRASSPEFCVKSAAVRAALRVNWCPGMRFKMAFETEDSSRISWFMGTVSKVQCADAAKWPDSPWRILQVSWDEPDLLQNVQRVNPWLVELVAGAPAMQLAPSSPPRKRLCLSQAPTIAAPLFSCDMPDSCGGGIQGARHAQFGISLSDLRFHKLQSGLLEAGNHRPERAFFMDSIAAGDRPRVVSGGTSSSSKTAPLFLLFGQPILTEQQISQGGSEAPPSSVCGSRGDSGEGSSH